MELPEENELVLGVIKKILPYGAFCTLPEYGNMEAFLHISEVAPRWIKNIHEFISEGGKHVVKVYRVDTEKQQVDISLKRVSEDEKRKKLALVKSEKRGDKLLELSIKTSKAPISVADARKAIEKEYEDVYSCFEVALEGEEGLKDIDIPKALKKKIVEIAIKSIKKSLVDINCKLLLTCYGTDGIGNVKQALDIKKEGVNIQYLGAPTYKITVTSEDYKKGEKVLSDVMDKIKSFSEKNNCKADFERVKE